MKNKRKLTVLLILAAILMAMLVFCFCMEQKRAQTEPMESPTVEQTTEIPTENESDTVVPNEPANTESDAESTDRQTDVTEPTETKPAETKPAETKPAETTSTPQYQKTS